MNMNMALTSNSKNNICDYLQSKKRLSTTYGITLFKDTWTNLHSKKGLSTTYGITLFKDTWTDNTQTKQRKTSADVNISI